MTNSSCNYQALVVLVGLFFSVVQQQTIIFLTDTFAGLHWYIHDKSSDSLLNATNLYTQLILTHVGRCWYQLTLLYVPLLHPVWGIIPTHNNKTQLGELWGLPDSFMYQRDCLLACSIHRLTNSLFLLHAEFVKIHCCNASNSNSKHSTHLEALTWV